MRISFYKLMSFAQTYLLALNDLIILRFHSFHRYAKNRFPYKLPDRSQTSGGSHLKQQDTSPLHWGQLKDSFQVTCKNIHLDCPGEIFSLSPLCLSHLSGPVPPARWGWLFSFSLQLKSVQLRSTCQSLLARLHSLEPPRIHFSNCGHCLIPGANLWVKNIAVFSKFIVEVISNWYVIPP